MNRYPIFICTMYLLAALACLPVDMSQPLPPPPLNTPAPSSTFTAIPFPTLIPTPTITPTPTLTGTPLIGNTATPLPSATPWGCSQRPLEDYTRIPIYDWEINQRTYAMLTYAQSIYAGPNDLFLGLTQGSYNEGVDASFGTHDGGGVIDLSVFNHGPEAGLLSIEQIEELVLALRHAGFAAWYRDAGDLYPGSPLHIHAVAVGDAQLSPAANEQLIGPNGYFRGRNGLPEPDGGPDLHGGPVICNWMLEAGYTDLR